ncbi:hypothetical protein EBT16_04755 [bacterium]|jgi:hypothetical protein|nr:hypothetical protein [bacterium]
MSTITISNSHAKIHAGECFSAYVGDSLSNNAYIELAINPSATVAPHLVFLCRSQDVATLTITEGITLTSGGVDFTPVAQNRNSPTTHNLQGIKVGKPSGTPIVHTGGTLIWSETMTVGGHTGAPATSYDHEMILKVNVWTVLRLTSSAGSNPCWMAVHWYT